MRSNETKRGRVLAAGAALATLIIVAPAGADDADPRVFSNPPSILMGTDLADESLLAPGRGVPIDNEVSLDLFVRFVDSSLYNPGTNSRDPVRLRGYQGTGIDPDAPYVAPIIEVTPGQTVRVTLHNQLPQDDTCTEAAHDVNTPHCFEGTNLHTHGFWVNPSGNGDNVLISINPGVSFQYEYMLPPDHPAGTFWYHPHRHGSTALQVSSGMVGALIVRGDRAPSLEENGDLDVLLTPSLDQPFQERILVLQQIAYACRDADGKIKVDAKGFWICDDGDVGTIEGYDQFGPGSWPTSGRYTSVNGLVLPTFSGALQGNVERWRVIHAGVRDTINLEFRKRAGGAADIKGLAAADAEKYINDNCTGEPLEYHLAAADGLTMANAAKTTNAVLQPGYRWDALVVFPEDGDYCVIDAAAPAGGSVDQNAPSRQLMGFVSVDPGQPVADITTHLTDQLIRAAHRTMPSDVKGAVISDLKDGLRLDRFEPHATLLDMSADEFGTQELVFNIDVSQTPPLFEVDGKPYDPSRMDRVLQLGGYDEWTLTSDFVSHPFHIHVNPFQVVEILDPSGKDVSAPGSVDDAGGVDPQYAGLKGVWKDTLWVKNNAASGDPKTGKYTIKVRTHYRRYIGDFVLHCHILDHEDQGMMQNVSIALPNGAGGVAMGHH